MNGLNQASLGVLVSKKMSVWMLVLVTAVTVTVFSVSFIQSRQMFFKQVAGWSTIVPDQMLTSLIDSDHFSIEREVRLLESTGLFSSVCIEDGQSRPVASFGIGACSRHDFVRIKDDAGEVWGFYSFQPDFFKFISPFVISGGVFLAFISVLYLIIRWQIRSNIREEFTRFNEFLIKMEHLTNTINHVDDEKYEPIPDWIAKQSSEQIIINKAFTKLVGEIRKANKLLKNAISSAEKKRYQDELTETALQIAHDIGSPLAVLEIIVQSAASLDEDSKVVIRGAIAKIRGITYSLLEKGRGAGNITTSCKAQLVQPHSLAWLMSQSVLEKRLEFQCQENVNITFECAHSSYGIFSSVVAADFNRILSNLINNAAQALELAGSVVVKLLVRDTSVLVAVEDNGKGIPSTVLEKLGERGVTHGKEEGNGLGVHHAKSTVESWGGEFSISSEIECGTCVSFLLPRVDHPEWYIPAIQIVPSHEIVVVSGDELIHQLWASRLESFQVCNSIHVNVTYVYSLFELSEWVRVNDTLKRHALYLCDYEFNGLDSDTINTINKLQISKASILVSGEYFEDKVISECVRSGIRILPKSVMSDIPIINMSAT
mgnify:CR=1 FL=1